MSSWREPEVGRRALFRVVLLDLKQTCRRNVTPALKVRSAAEAAAETNWSTVVPDDPIHLRVLYVLSAIRELSPFDTMTAEEDQLLRSLLVRWHQAAEVSVSEVMAGMVGVSQATAYRRIMSLRDKGLIYLRIDRADKRVKFVEPTASAMKYASHIHTGLESLVLQKNPK